MGFTHTKSEVFVVRTTRSFQTSRKLAIGLALLLMSFGSTAAFGIGLVDFEDAPVHGGDNAPVSDQYKLSHGVTFSVLFGPTKATAVPGLPTFEAVGGADTQQGFVYDGGGVFDTEDPLAAGQLGRFFLKSSNNVYATGYVKLIIDYENPVAAASGQIWDIDGSQSLGTEQWRITAFDGGGFVVDSSLSPLGITNDPASLDGLPWNWILSAASIEKIEIEFVGTKTEFVGLAFDNFWTSDVPEPVTMTLLTMGGFVAFLMRRRK